MAEKILTGTNVFHAATGRIEWIFESFSTIYLSFSGGKDSTVLFPLMANTARKMQRRFSVLFIDWEAQYQYTIQHVKKCKLCMMMS